MPPPPPADALPFHPALSLGPEAAALRETPAPGRVLAVLRAAVYLEGEGGEVLALVGPTAPDGPLTVCVPDLAPLLPRLRDQPDAPFHATPEALVIGGAIHIPWASTTCWIPRLPATLAPPPARAAAAETLGALLAADAIGESAGPTLPSLWQIMSTNTPLFLSGRGAEGEGRSGHVPSAHPADPKLDLVQQRLLTHCTTLYSTWRAGDRAATEAAVQLLGLGPGLTPSGDDVLMGLLAALQWQARLGALLLEPVAALTAAVLAAAPQQTTRLSTRLLHHAAAGTLYAPAMDLGAALLAGDPTAIPVPTRRLLAIGHTSGADMAHGLLLGTLLGLQGDPSIG